ncbi:MAG TPA: Trm112 family protein [Thermohalobaculum sp.]|nr:Trm112 family protein [Thermohalobaculum sp.]
MTNSEFEAGQTNSQKPSPKLLETLVCPASGGRLEYDADKAELISRTAMLAYPIRSGIPIMLIDEARKIDG